MPGHDDVKRESHVDDNILDSCYCKQDSLAAMNLLSSCRRGSQLRVGLVASNRDAVTQNVWPWSGSLSGADLERKRQSLPFFGHVGTKEKGGLRQGVSSGTWYNISTGVELER